MKRTITRAVFKMSYAAKLIQMGHEVIEILPNPAKPKFNMWIFKYDETFDEDFKKLRGKE